MEVVSLVGCKDYEYSYVRESIKKTFEHLGGIEKYINRGELVLLKVNLLMKKRPEEATTTHPNFVRALAEELLEYGAKVIIGDSPGGPFNKKMLKGVYKICGYEEIAEKLPVELNYNIHAADVKNPKGKILKKLTVIDVMTKVDKVISVSKLKTHGMTMFTGAVKNMFGTIPGVLKAEYHFKMPKIEDFTNMLVDVCVYANPVLSFMDAIVGMEGAGPSAGKPRKIGLVIGSTSPYHLDAVATKIIGIEPSKVPTIKRTIERNILAADYSDILYKGEHLEDFIIDDFKVPNTRSVEFFDEKVPAFIKKPIDYLMKPKPIFIHEKCVGCGDCKEACPPRAIEMKDNRPYVDLNTCIRCFCCQELCPLKAVEIKRPWIVQKFL